MGRIQAVLRVAKWAVALGFASGCGISFYIDDPQMTPQPLPAAPPIPPPSPKPNTPPPVVKPATNEEGADQYYSTLIDYACDRGGPSTDAKVSVFSPCLHAIDPNMVTGDSETTCAEDPAVNEALSQFQKLCAAPALFTKPGLFSKLPPLVHEALRGMKKDYEQALVSREKGELIDEIYLIKQGLCDGRLRLMQSSLPESMAKRVFSAATCSEKSTHQATPPMRMAVDLNNLPEAVPEQLADLHRLDDWLRRNIAVKPEAMSKFKGPLGPRMAVLNPSNQVMGGDSQMDRLAEQLTDEIKKSLANVYQLAPARDTAEMRNVLCRGMTDANCFPAIGKNMDVDYVIFGDLKGSLPGTVVAEMQKVVVLDPDHPVRVRNFPLSPNPTPEELAREAGVMLFLLGEIP